MGIFKKKIVKKTYDREHMKPVIRASICTGEEVAGFKDIRTGKIEEIMLIRSPEDLEKFKEIYEIAEEITKEYQTLDKGDVYCEKEICYSDNINKKAAYKWGDQMEAAQRIRLIRIIEKMEKNSAFSNKLGIKNASEYSAEKEQKK